MSHAEDVPAPKLSGICSGGDIIGYKEIDNGLSVDEHTWIMAPHEADIFVLSLEYVKYLWHKNKQYDNSLYVDLIQQNP